MGWLQNVIKIIVPPGVDAAVKIAQGAPVVDAIKKDITAPATVAVDVAAAAASAVNTVDQKITQLEQTLAEKIGGDRAQSLFLDLRRTNSLVDTNGVTQSVQKFVETLDPGYLDPLVGQLAAEIQRARDTFWEAAAPIPDDVVASMPVALRNLAGTSRCILASATNNLSLPAFAIEHLARATAITMIDVIFFKVIPTVETVDERFYWAHELTHVQQYRDLGLMEFAKRYVHESIRGGLVSLEEAADKNACRAFPGGHPYYIQSCAGA